jgi:hypothetical protein
MILFGVLGLGPLVAARLAWVRHPFGPVAALAVGGALLIWVAVEIAIIGYSNEPPLQAGYLALGSAITLVALAWLVIAGLAGYHATSTRLSGAPAVDTRRRGGR